MDIRLKLKQEDIYKQMILFRHLFPMRPSLSCFKIATGAEVLEDIRRH